MTAADEAVTALVTAITAGVGGVQVIDGIPVTVDMDYVAVAYTPLDDQAVEVTREWAGLGAQRREETVTVRGFVDSWSGDPSPSARRARCMALFEQVDAAVHADVTLGGVVRQALITDWQLYQQAAVNEAGQPAGIDMGIAFTVTCSVRI